MGASRLTTVRFDEVDSNYLLVRLLNGSTAGSIALVLSLRDSQVYIRKRIYGKPVELLDGLPAEIYFSTLNDWPELPYLPDSVCWMDYEDGRFSMIMKFYNGGTLEDLINHYCKNDTKKRRRISEDFIWYYLEQVGAAYAFLHRGIQRGNPTPKQWNPIVHRDGNSCNLLLHYPDASTDRYPDIIVSDFGQAVHPDSDVTLGGTWPRAEEYTDEGLSLHAQLWEDYGCVGIVLRELCCCSVYRTQNQMAAGVDLDEAFPKDFYSAELWDVVRTLQYDFRNDNSTSKDSDHFFNDILPLAKQKMVEYRKAGQSSSVSWTRPKEVTPFPLVLNQPSVVEARKAKGIRQSASFVLGHNGS